MHNCGWCLAGMRSSCGTVALARVHISLGTRRKDEAVSTTRKIHSDIYVRCDLKENIPDSVLIISHLSREILAPSMQNEHPSIQLVIGCPISHHCAKTQAPTRTLFVTTQATPSLSPDSSPPLPSSRAVLVTNRHPHQHPCLTSPV